MSLQYMQNNRELNFWEKLFYPEIAKGMAVTFRHFFRNWLGKRDTVTKQYPEEKFPWSYRTRGRHYLTKRSDGRLSCVACMMCAMACPSNAIKIEIKELETPYYTKRQKIDRCPKSFTINQLTCIYCGFCVEACPEDAIRMDSGRTMLAVDQREETMIPIESLSEAPAQEHELFFNPLPADMPAEAPREVIPEEQVKRREY